ncbi:hypothetical protein BE21_29190 [Sorangium cellulosum]|uniref:Uncharacterized protein n=1 Tax=Sorangium cellulosum TaxID=56 RepID=A0A150TS04_SORCE|nr:hypothetical protein BE21_29190 [Sorangium cellulosum]
MGEDSAAELTLLDLDTEGLLLSALEQIQHACGDLWQRDDADPGHDCALTPLGQGFGAEWRTSPEFALVRLLTMTPANADMTGTSLEDLQQFYENNPGTFSYDFADILAEALGISRTAPLLPIPKLVQALQQQLLGTHPAVPDADGRKMPVTLYEALHDLEPLSEKLGPSGGHPGVLVRDDGTFTTRSELLLPDFEMRIFAESGLRRVMKIDLSKGSKGGGHMFVREGDALLRFELDDPEGFQITGVAEHPTVDLRIALRELPTTVPSCTETPACQDNSPDMPVGDGTIWRVSPFLLEPIVTRAAYLTYSEREFTGCYFQASGSCRLGMNIGQGGDPPGWTVFNADLSFPPDPPPQVPSHQFLWELLTEIAQVVVHDPTGDGAREMAEGEVQPVYALQGVDLGITADDVTAGFRRALESRAGEIAESVVGRYWEENASLDLFYGRGAPGGAPYLYFVTKDDLRPSDQNPAVPRDYTYTKPGFFTSPDLDAASKVSKKEIDGVGDKTHEKLRLLPGETMLYMQDDEAAVYQVRFHVPDEEDPVEIIAEVRRL